MTIRPGLALGLMIASAAIGGATRANVAFAQFGGRISGNLFRQAQDAAALWQSPHQSGTEPTDSPYDDPYSPQVWTVRQSTRSAGPGSMRPVYYNARTRPPMHMTRAAYQQEPTPAEAPPPVPSPATVAPSDSAEPQMNAPTEEIYGSPDGSYDGTYGAPYEEMYGGPYDGMYGGPYDGMYEGPYDDGFAGPPCAQCGHAHPAEASCGYGSCGPQHCCLLVPQLGYSEVFGGVHGFKGPRDSALNGNFGFQEGFNVGASMPICHHDIGFQLGAQAVQSNLSGTGYGEVLGDDDLGADDRNQYFLTAGVFERVPCGFQWGVAWDWMHDEYLDNIDLFQLRAELSLVNVAGHEIGFLSTISLNYDDGATINQFGQLAPAQWRAADQFVGFYRWRFACCSEVRLWGGFSGTNDGILGGDARVPLTDNLSLWLNANYLLPDESIGIQGATMEQWNLAIYLSWHFGCGGSKTRSPCRPLFDVADNGRFFVEPRRTLFPDTD